MVQREKFALRSDNFVVIQIGNDLAGKDWKEDIAAVRRRENYPIPV